MNNIIIKDNSGILVDRPELKPMLESFSSNLPELIRGKENFGKSQSQFMDNILTVSKHTPIRNMRQILAEVERTYQGLQEAYFKHKKQAIEVRIIKRDIEKESDELKRELMLVDLEEKSAMAKTSEVYISGAIRKLHNYSEQYKSIQVKLMQEQGVKEFSEIDFEAEEEEYHIKTAFSQAINAARASGRVDEGNQIYFQQLGINGAAADTEIQGLFKVEQEFLKNGQTPPNKLVLDFLDNVAKKYKGCSQEMVEYRGMQLVTDTATVSPKLLEN